MSINDMVFGCQKFMTGLQLHLQERSGLHGGGEDGSVFLIREASLRIRN